MAFKIYFSFNNDIKTLERKIELLLSHHSGEVGDNGEGIDDEK